ncbi:MAG: tetratricopeptide repeat protein [Ilumatobacteraceae bacterium]
MPTPITGYRIFLASPGGLEEERDLVVNEVALYNEVHGFKQGIAFFVVRWEKLPRGAGRPQSRINPYVEGSDFLVMIVGGHLGSATTPTPPYRTGVEEELATAAQAMGNAEMPMTDLFLLFKAPSDADLLAPTDDYKRVQQFRYEIETTKEVFYSQFGTLEELRQRLVLQLEAWAQTASPKTPTPLPRLLAALEQREVHSMAEPPSDRPDDLVSWAETQAGLGMITSADKAFAAAAVHQKPGHLLRYARFLQRTGQLERAHELNQRVIVATEGAGDPSLLSYRARALANMGLIRRKQGDLARSVDLLLKAVALGDARYGVEQEALCYAFDQLGLTQTRLGNSSDAQSAFEESLSRRTEAGDVIGRAQSLINLARIDRQQGQSESALRRLDEAVGLLDTGDNEPALANALSALGSLLIPSDPVRAQSVLRRSLQLNQKLELSDGVSVASNDLALLYLSLGDPENAAMCADQAMEVSSRSGNKEGRAVALRLLGQIRMAKNEWVQAIDVLRSAVEAATALRDPGREGSARLWLAKALKGGGREPWVEEAEQALECAKKASDVATLNEALALLAPLQRPGSG